MAIGKREQIVGISIGALLVIGIVHMAIFKPRSDAYATTLQEYTNGTGQLKGAEVLSSDKVLNDFRVRTEQYDKQLTSITESLNLGVPDYYSSVTMENIRARVDDTIRLVRQLVELRAGVRQPQLTFLDNRTDPRYPGVQFGWNLQRQLPNLGAAGAVWDTVAKLEQRHQLLNNIPDPVLRLKQRSIYNQLLQRLGLNPIEVSDFYATLPQLGPVFFNDAELVVRVPGAQFNPWSIGRFGTVVPAIKKLWFLELLYQQSDPKNPVPVTKERLGIVLEINVPFDDTLLSINHQLQSLIDIIRIAERDQVLEISQVNLMRPVDFGKVEQRVPGKTPGPSPTPNTGMAQPGVMGAPVMAGQSAVAAGIVPGMPGPIPPDQKVGTGSGIELTFRATNPNMVKFLFDIGTSPRTYSVDDLHVQASPDGILNTSATIELITKLDTLKSATP
ncbi:MAG: hypothetical protein ACR2IE_03835 [Candidatus Sumerlaeaceae bacterium]